MARLALLFLLVISAPTLAAGEGGATPPGRASLKLVGIDPVTVVGRAFKPGERVRLSADGRRKTVTAGTRGGFKVVFPEANVCNGFVAVARGSAGSRASVTFAQFSNVHCLEPQSTPSVKPKPALRVLTREPLAVRGTGFRPSENVRLIALGSLKRVVRQTRSDERGIFKASFRLGPDRSAHLVVSAVGSQGSRAFVTVMRRPSDPPPRQ